jgi:KUP system potassium uptake protein
VTELVNSEKVTPDSVKGDKPLGSEPRSGSGWLRPALLLGALGVVYGDIGTSPLYALQTVFTIDNGAVRPTPSDVYGVISLVFWSITLIVSVKYVLFVLRADNDGEGGVMSLAALIHRFLDKSNSRRGALLLGLGVLGASLFYGDSVITPAISMLSAVEGLEVSQPGLKEFVLPIAVVILTLLFIIQRFGTQRVGSAFGPVMLVWFVSLGGFGLREIIRHPSVIKGLSPTYGVAFIGDRPAVAFVAMGAVVLTITGAEALYADMGHFGPGPIRVAWFALVFPALTLNYLGQGSLILQSPDARSNPFFILMPSWTQIPMVVLATMATVIASQAVISGAFSVSRQALRLGYLPHLRIRQTSTEHEGQVFVPAVNRGLFVAVLVVTVGFGSSAKLSTAYGVAVTGTFLITTSLFLILARVQWQWPTWRLVLIGLLFGVPELTYFAANLTKVAHGGWLTLLIALTVFTTMTTWHRGRQIATERRIEMEGPLRQFLDKLHSSKVSRVPGIAVFPHPSADTTPLALVNNVAHNHVLHQQVVIISGRTASVPHVPWDRRLTVEDLGDPSDGILYIAATFGFDDRTDFPEVLRRGLAQRGDGGRTADGQELDPSTASYFVSRISLRRSKQPGMVRWRKQLFIILAHNAASQAEFLGLPEERTVVMSAQVAV